ncbi:hypothetical protein EOL96_01765, partial [Candidatus Saccharibacteria bacterium]|nr:hypothetical protein [Candidatus Saccharibacteria bacterium]
IFRAIFTRVGGGSTITQQLAKNTVLSDERSFMRKYQELAVSIAIEQNYTKDEILSMYLNSVYYGENAFGIDEAARVYFNKSPKDLTLAESAMLIGILPAPSAYSPISGNIEYALQRQNTVLTRMLSNGYITEQQKEEALSEKLAFGEGAKSEKSIAPHFVEMVINELSEKYGYEKVMRSGYQVTTSLDVAAQTTLNQNIANQITYVTNNGGSNISAVIVDPTTGEVRALAGSADYENEKWGKVNMVTTARQPGSSFKPIYYAHALADGVITPATIILDEETDFGGGYTPKNASRLWYGNVSVRKALSWSLNIPSIKVMQKYTIDKSVRAAGELGINLDENRDHNLTLALGSEEVSLIDMTNAYAAFANEGKQYKNATILQVNDKFNKIVMKNDSLAKQAINKEGAFLISNILSDNQARSGIFGSSLTVNGHTTAVKTGTTDDSRDAWTIGYSPDYAIGVWVGNNDNTPMNNGGAGMAGPVWRQTMQTLLNGSPDKKFAVPSSIVQRTVCSSNGGLATRDGVGTYLEYFMAGALPTESCTPNPVMITVCDLNTKKTELIEENSFDESLYSKDLDECKDIKIKVCETESGKIVTIQESEFDAATHSKDVENCSNNPADEKIEACDTYTGRVVRISPELLGDGRYTSDTDNCEKSPTN